MIFIYNPDTLEKSDILVNTTSIQWTERFYEAGGFEIHFDEDNEHLIRGNIVSFGGMFGKIEKVSKTFNDIAIFGYDMKVLAKQRFCMGREFESTDVETVFKTLIDENMINASDEDRNIPLLSLAENRHTGDEIDYKVENKTLSEVFNELALKYEIGYSFSVDNGYIFDVKKGTDRSGDIIFSRDFNNIDNVEYADDGLNEINFAYSKKEITDEDGNGTGTYNILTFGTAKGIGRYEGYCENADDAENYIAENSAQETLTGEIADSTANLKYGIDYFLGDYVTVRFGDMSAVKQITEVKHVCEKANNKIDIIFGTEKNNPIKKLLKT